MRPLLVAALAFLTACNNSALPRSLANHEFWTLVETLSEPPGTFPLSANLVSNEPHFAERVRRMRRAGGVYVGVGPEQNFTYIAALRPSLAFIVDIRRENRNLHLLYKALFELASDRAEFVSLLFSRPRPGGAASLRDVDKIFDQIDSVAPSQDFYAATSVRVRERLLGTRALPLTGADLREVEDTLRAFYTHGPAIHFWGAREDTDAPSYRQLMTARDITGRTRSYLATEDGFRFVKAMHTQNLIVPLVGDFGGATALRGVGEYVRKRHGLIQAFYGSNVGVYLTRTQMTAFCQTLNMLPVSRRAVFVENKGMRTFASRLAACPGTAN